MKFSKLIIKNFRSFGPEGVEITFRSDGNIAAIVGANGSGKSNIIAALGIVLNVVPFTKFEPDPTDFYNANDEVELLIELHLSPPLMAQDVYNATYEISGFRYLSRKYKRGEEKGSLRSEHWCFGPDGKALIKSQRIYKSVEKNENADNIKLPVRVSDHAFKLGGAFYLDAPTLEKFFDRTTGWSPLARLLNLYRNDFTKAHNTFQWKEETITAQEAYRRLTGYLQKALETEKLKEIQSELSDTFQSYIGKAGEGDPLRVALGLPTAQTIFEESMALHVLEYTGAPMLPVDRLGTGYRALLRLAVMETLLRIDEKDKKMILLIEEPEVYLHTHLRRHACKVLHRLAANGHAVIFTTHAPECIELSCPEEIIRMHRRTGAPSTVSQVPTTAQFDFADMKKKLGRTPNTEVVFARHVVLVEGIDDQAVWHRIFDIMGIDPDVHSISIVDCTGSELIPQYVHLCGHLGIDFYAIYDEDPNKGDTPEKRNRRIVEAITQHSPPFIPGGHMYKPDLEGVMQTQKIKNNTEHLLGLIDAHPDLESLKAAYPDLVRPVEEFALSRGLITATPTSRPQVPVLESDTV